MPLTLCTGDNARELQRNRFAIKHRRNPADRPDESLRRLSSPVHALWPCNGADLLGQSLQQHLVRTPTDSRHRGRNVFALWRFDSCELGDAHARFLGKSLGGSRWSTIFICNAHRRPCELFFDIRLTLANAMGNHAKPSRRREGFHTRRFGNSLTAKQLLDALLEFIPGRIQHARGNPFNADLQQQPSHQAFTATLCYSTVNSADCWSAYAFAIPTANARMRAITPTRSVTEIAPRASKMLKRCEHFRHRSKAASTGKRRISTALTFSFFRNAKYSSTSALHSASYNRKCSQVFSTSARSKL